MTTTAGAETETVSAPISRCDEATEADDASSSSGEVLEFRGTCRSCFT
ncbi:hypothetical protein HMPREF9056_00712 [Actinomyces sp. oral taxon 170 str. F0386]|nr:hypothetical protein HMPREF9056_00712 [Actinomyces sp. oral taxon 170 str. F0386]